MMLPSLLKYCNIAKRFPGYISSDVNVSTCCYQQAFCSVEIEYYQSIVFQFLSEFQFLSCVTLGVLEFCHNLIFFLFLQIGGFEFYKNIEFLSLLLFQFLSLLLFNFFIVFWVL